MAPIALLICVIFILAALRQDIKESQNVSRVLWIPLIWLVECASKPLSLWLYPGWIFAERTELNYIEGNPIEKVIFTFLLGAAVLILLKRRTVIDLRFRANAFLLIYIVYAGTSIAWSEYQGVSIRRWIRLINDAIMVAIILSEKDPNEAIERTLRRCAILLIPLSLLFVRFYGNIGIGYTRTGERTWTGVTTNKNELGLLCAFMGVFLLWRLIKAWPRINVLDGSLLLMTFYLLRGSRSMTSVFVLALGTGILFLHASVKGNIKKFKRLVVAVLLLILLINGLSILIFDQTLESVFFTVIDRNATLTGRIPMWDVLIKIGMRKPMIGPGLGNFWIINLRSLWDQFAFRPIQAHNGYIDVFLDLGIVGLVLLLLMILQAYKKIMNFFAENWRTAALMFVFFVMILFHNISEATLTKTNLLWALFLVSSVSIGKSASHSDASGG